MNSFSEDVLKIWGILVTKPHMKKAAEFNEFFWAHLQAAIARQEILKYFIKPRLSSCGVCLEEFKNSFWGFRNFWHYFLMYL